MNTLTLLISTLMFTSGFTMARVKYDGGGDWYNDPEVIPNLAREANRRISIDMNEKQGIVSLDDPEIFNYPILYLTGHGNIVFSESEIKNLRKYLLNGGFLYADDDYGMDKAFRREMKRVFPDLDWVELGPQHPIYHTVYDFDKLPKIHEHYKGPPHMYALIYNDRIIVLYTYNTNISDGWTDRHGDPPQKREQAIKMGINIVVYALSY